MSAVSKSVKVPHILEEHLTDLAHACGYDTVNAFLIGRVRCALLHLKRDNFAARVARLPFHDQDKVDQRLIHDFIEWQKGNAHDIGEKIDEAKQLVQESAGGEDCIACKLIEMLIDRK